MNKIKFFLCAAVMGLGVLGGCTTTTGAVTGGVAGAAVGGTAGAVGGAVLGGVIGHENQKR